MDGVVNGDRGERRVGRFVGQFELLPGREPDDAPESELLNRIIVLRLNELLLARFQFHFRTQAVDFWRRAGFHLVGGLIEKRLRGVHLRGEAFDARGIGDRLQIGVADGEDDQIARVLRVYSAAFRFCVAACVLLIAFRSSIDCVRYARESK